MKAVVQEIIETIISPRKLNDLKDGDVFRFAEVSFDNAMKNDQQGFYMKINLLPKSNDRVTAVSLDGKTIISRDADRLVYSHPTEIFINLKPTQS